MNTYQHINDMSRQLIHNETFTMKPGILNQTGQGSDLLDLIIEQQDMNVGGSLLASDITHIMGPTRDALYIVIPITVIYAVIFVTGVIGNISTCIVIAKNKSMHTATNYYLFSLAVSDLLLLVAGLPQEMWSIWSRYPYVFGESFCIIRGLAAETSANATVLTITAFTIERYVAICHPFLSHTMSKLSRAVKLILIVWLISLSFALPQALQFGIVLHHELELCVVKKVILEHSFELSTFLFFLTPMTLITVLYALIGCRLRASSMMKREISLRHRRTKGIMHAPSFDCDRRKTHHGCSKDFNYLTTSTGGVECCSPDSLPKSTRSGKATGVSKSKRKDRIHGRSSRRVLKMLVAVVVAFFICWAPFHAQRLVAIYGTNPENNEPSRPIMLHIYAIMTYISGVLYYVSTCVNPLLYNIMSNKFREAFKDTLARRCPCFMLLGRGRLSASAAASANPDASVPALGGTNTMAANSTLGYYTVLTTRSKCIRNDSENNSRINNSDIIKNETGAISRYDGKSNSRVCSEAQESTTSGYSANSQSFREDSQISCPVRGVSPNSSTSFIVTSAGNGSCLRHTYNDSDAVTKQDKLLGPGMKKIWKKLATHGRHNPTNLNNNSKINDEQGKPSSESTQIGDEQNHVDQRNIIIASDLIQGAQRVSQPNAAETGCHSLTQQNMNKMNPHDAYLHPNNEDCDELSCYMRELRRRELQRR